MSLWSQPAFSGAPSSTCWRANASWCSRTRRMSKPCQVERLTSATVSGCSSCCSMHGLIRGSFIPPAAIRELRELTRYRTSLIQERRREVNRVQKVLEDANIKLASVASDRLGPSGRRMIEALLAEELQPTAIADLAKGALRRKRAELEQALEGRLRAHHRVLLRELLDHLDYLSRVIE